MGQVLTYVALARRDLNFTRPVLGVLATFEILPDLLTTIEVLNLGIEVVLLPEQLRLAGSVPSTAPSILVPQIPLLPATQPATAVVDLREDA